MHKFRQFLQRAVIWVNHRYYVAGEIVDDEQLSSDLLFTLDNEGVAKNVFPTKKNSERWSVVFPFLSPAAGFAILQTHLQVVSASLQQALVV